MHKQGEPMKKLFARGPNFISRLMSLLTATALSVIMATSAAHAGESAAATIIEQAQKINSLYNEYSAHARAARKSLPTTKDRSGEWIHGNIYTLIPIVNNVDIYNDVITSYYEHSFMIWQHRREEVYLLMPDLGAFKDNARLLALYNFCNPSPAANIAQAFDRSRQGDLGEKCLLWSEEYFRQKVCARIPVCARSTFNFPVIKGRRYVLLYRFEGF